MELIVKLNSARRAAVLNDILVVDDGGSIVLLTPGTPAGRDWCNEHLPEDGAMLGAGYAVERRYVGDIVDGMQADGLRLAL